MIPQYELKAEDVHSYAIQKMKEYIPIEAHGYCCNREMIYDVQSQCGEQQRGSDLCGSGGGGGQQHDP